MKKFVILIVTAVFAFSSCIFDIFGEAGNGVTVKKAIEVGAFTAISVPHSIDVYYTQTLSDQELVLTCDENLVDYYNITVENGVLSVGMQPGVSVRTKVRSYLTVNSPALEYIKLSGSGDVFVGSPIVAAGDFEIHASGSGDLESRYGVECRNFSARTSGSGDISVGGVTAASAEFKSSGSGDLKSGAVTAESVAVVLTGSGDCWLDCKNAGLVGVKLSGSGDCTLSGTARTLGNVSITGSGKLDTNRLSVGQ